LFFFVTHLSEPTWHPHHSLFTFANSVL
jgi:hypothetical protein